MTKHAQEILAPPWGFDLEKESFLASGVPDNELLLNYRYKLNDLYHQFIRSVAPPHDPLAKAETLFKWLWVKPAVTNLMAVSD
jgi:hypothetical protein